MDYGDVVVYPPATSIALRVKLLSFLISKIMCVPTYLNPGFTFPSLIWSGVTPIPLKPLKRQGEFPFNFQLIFFQKVVPVCWSILYASSTYLGTWIPNLCVVLQFFFDLRDNLVSFLKNMLHPPFEGGFSAMFSDTVYSASSTGFEYLRLFNSIQLKVPSFHSTSN